MPSPIYNARDFGKSEVELMNKFHLQVDDARTHFLNFIKPRLDRSYKLYTAYTGDRRLQIQSWQCISEDTQILSINGWKSMGELSKGDTVLSYDLETGALLPDTVRADFSYEVDGDMVSIKNEGTDQLVTTNHRVILKKCKKQKKDNNPDQKGVRQRVWDTSFNYVEAGELVDGGADYRLPLSGTYDGPTSIGGDVAEFVGWFITDGCLPKSGVPYIAQAKPETLAKLRSLLVSLKVPFREWSREKGEGNYDEHRFYIPRDCELMKQVLSLAPDRKPSEKLWHITLSEKRRLLDGIFMGDGSKRPDGKYHMVSKPKAEFKEWLQTLLHLSGLRGSIRDTYVNVAHSSTIDVFRKRHVKKVSFKGKVWSITTGRSNYIARRNGLIFVTGNSNIFVPYVQAVVETLIPRIIDARPEFTCHGRTQYDQMKAEKQQQLQDYFWEISKMDKVTEELCRCALVYGTGYLQASWKKDVREYKFLDTKDITSKKPKYKKEKKTFYDAPFAESVDNYSLWYDWHNVARESKQYWFKRLVLTEGEIKRKYPGADPERLKMALARPGGDLNDYAAVRYATKQNHELITRGASQYQTAVRGANGDRYNVQSDQSLQMYEVFEWTRPFDDAYSVVVNWVPIFDGGEMPLAYDFKEAPFIEVPYLRLPGEFEGVGIPMILENPQIMLNTIKNQRLDAATLSIHKMWIVNPLANISKEELVARPFGIIYSPDPNGVREVQFSDIKSSAYKEEDMLKSDMRYASGVDDSSMGVGGSAGSATEVRHLRESTLERVRLFVNHLGDAYADVMRYWMSMQRQFFTKNMQIRIIGDNGKEEFPLIEEDDLKGEFDYKATVLPSLAGQNDIEKKQNMDLFQLLVSMPFIDPKKLTSKTLEPWNFSLESVEADQEAAPPEEPGMEGMPPEGAEGMPPEMMPPEEEGQTGGLPLPGTQIPPDVLTSALAMLRGGAIPGADGNNPSFDASSAYADAKTPVNLTKGKSAPPTLKGIQPSKANPAVGRVIGTTTNPRGLNRGGKVNTNISKNGPSDPGANIARQASNTQR